MKPVDKQAKFIWNQSWMALPHSTHGGHTQKRAVNECYQRLFKTEWKRCIVGTCPERAGYAQTDKMIRDQRTRDYGQQLQRPWHAPKHRFNPPSGQNSQALDIANMATFEVKDKSVYQKRFDRFRTHG
ncbi:unnamed protein product, partial [Fusarium fujikuroi]